LRVFWPRIQLLVAVTFPRKEVLWKEFTLPQETLVAFVLHVWNTAVYHLQLMKEILQACDRTVPCACGIATICVLIFASGCTKP
jgi:hypothetical protein